jgi:hypothetical protein
MSIHCILHSGEYKKGGGGHAESRFVQVYVCNFRWAMDLCCCLMSMSILIALLPFVTSFALCNHPQDLLLTRSQT